MGKVNINEKLIKRLGKEKDIDLAEEFGISRELMIGG